MRALLVASAAREGSEAIVRRLAREADLVIAVDGGADLCTAADVRPDVVVGDLDSASEGAMTQAREADVPVVTFSADKDVSDLELAIEHARRAAADTLVVVGALGARLDHTLATIGSLARAADLRPTAVEPGYEVRFLNAHGAHEARIEGEGTVFSLVGVLEDSVVSVRDARWPLDAATLPALSSWGVGNRVANDSAVVTVHFGTCAVLVHTG